MNIQHYRKKIHYGLAVVITTALLASCASQANYSRKAAPAHKVTVKQKNSPVYQALLRQYRNWYGTPYRIGGLSRGGIDCSGFVHIAFRDAFGMSVPRSTEHLVDAGQTISRQHLNIGDLVFFKTGMFKRHVGIYVGNGHFIHASTSNGVTKSKMSNPYWEKHYWKSVRLLSN